VKLIKIGAKLLVEYNPKNLSSIINKKYQTLTNLEHATYSNLVDQNQVNLESTSQKPNPEVPHVNPSKGKPDLAQQIHQDHNQVMFNQL